MEKRPVFYILTASVAFFVVFLIIVFSVSKMNKSGVSKSSFSSYSGSNIGVIEIKGIIKDSKKDLERINAYKDDKSIKAIIVRIDSPGGVVGPSQEIYEALTKVDNKPVIASLGAIAASGGYYIAVGAKKIVSNPGTLTGSIGVILEQVNLSKLYDYIKVKRFAIKAGKYKDAGAEFRDLTDEERALFQGTVDDTHIQFIEAVAKGRNLSIADVKKFADGRIVTGRQALALKMVDSLGNFDDAVALAAKEAGIKGKPKVVYPPKPSGSLISMLFESQSDDMEELFDKLLTSQFEKKLMYLFK